MKSMSWFGSQTTEKSTVKLIPTQCKMDTERQCTDGSCIPRMELCPEEEMLDQDTILIMIGVGMGVVLFLILLYCLQQRRNSQADQQVPMNADDADHPELLMPPPTYNEAVDVSLYPPTPQTHRNRISSLTEPITPPPNYDTALNILAQSHESVLIAKEPGPPSPTQASPMIRRAQSVELMGGISRSRPMTFSSFGANAKTFKSTSRERGT